MTLRAFAVCTFRRERWYFAMMFYPETFNKKRFLRLAKRAMQRKGIDGRVPLEFRQEMVWA